MRIILDMSFGRPESRRRVPALFGRVAVLVTVLSTVSCGSAVQTAGSGARFIVPKPADGMVLVSTTDEAVGQASTPEQHPAVKVPLTSDYIVEQVIDTNLDIDDMDEQIIVYKRAPGAKIEPPKIPPPSTTSYSSSPAGGDYGVLPSGGEGTARAPAGASGAAGSQFAGASDAIGAELMVPVQPGQGANRVGPSNVGAASSTTGGTAAGSGAGGGQSTAGTGAPGGTDAAAAGSAEPSGAITSTTAAAADAGAGSLSDNIWIMIADFDTVRNTYLVTWEGATSATNPRTFTVYPEDLTGDHNLEIVCRGTNARGEQTLDVFRRTGPFIGSGLRYQDVLSIVSDGNIEIQESDRSDAYHSGAQTTGQSFPVSTLTRDLSSDNPLDMIRTTYLFNPRAERYAKGGTEKVPGARVEASQLATLYNGTASDFEDFLNGPWYRSDDGAGGSAPSLDSVDVLFFNAAGKSMVFSSGEVLEAFGIQESYKTSFQRGILVKLQNESIPTLTQNGAISVPATDTIVVQGTGVWDGTYKRLSSGLNQTLFGKNQAGVTLSSLKLSGLYRDDNGGELFFSPPRYTLRAGSSEQSGGFVLYQYGLQKVLELRAITDMSRLTDRRVYLVDYTEEATKTQNIRTLKLTPAVVSVKGVEPLNNDTLRYEQIVQKDKGAGGTRAPATGDSASGASSGATQPAQPATR